MLPLASRLVLAKTEPHVHAPVQGETHALDDRQEARDAVKATLASIAAAAEKAHHHDDEPFAEPIPGAQDREHIEVPVILPERSAEESDRAVEAPDLGSNGEDPDRD